MCKNFVFFLDSSELCFFICQKHDELLCKSFFIIYIKFYTFFERKNKFCMALNFSIFEQFFISRNFLMIFQLLLLILISDDNFMFCFAIFSFYTSLNQNLDGIPMWYIWSSQVIPWNSKSKPGVVITNWNILCQQEDQHIWLNPSLELF